MFPKAPVRSRIEKATVKIKRRGSDKITIRKDVRLQSEKELTESNCVDKVSPANIL